MKDVGNQEYVRRLNRVNILNIIRENSGLSRQELANRTGLTPAAMSGIVRELVENGYVVEMGLGKSSGGRRPVELKFNPEAGYVIGGEITRRRTTLGIVNLQAKSVKIKHIPIDMTDPKSGLDLLTRQMDELILSTGISEKKIMGAGFAFPGLLDRRTKRLRRSPNLGDKWTDIPLKEWLEERIRVPLVIENNSNAGALAEYTLGRGKDVKDLAYVNLGEGFSTGVIINEQIINGSQGFAGEMGHVVLVEDGPLCNCGNKGCLESLYAVPALIRKANNELSLSDESDCLKKIWRQQGEVTIEDILACSGEVDSYAWQLIRQAGWYIGIGISGIINFYNPEIIALGGILSQAGPVLMKPLVESISTHAFPEIAKATRIEISTIGLEAGFYGACLGAIKRLFSAERPENILSIPLTGN
ncbi:MAG: ROK family transcriptional regulator [Desulfitobacteriaceae bacterium]